MTACISDKSLNKIVSEKTEKNKLSLPKSIKMSDSPRIGSDCKFLIPILNPAGVVCKRKKIYYEYRAVISVLFLSKDRKTSTRKIWFDHYKYLFLFHFLKLKALLLKLKFNCNPPPPFKKKNFDYLQNLRWFRLNFHGC